MTNKKIYIGLLIIAIISAAFCLLVRVQSESKSKVVDFAIDYDELYSLSKQSDHDLKWWLTKMKELGVRSVGLKEESIESLINENKPIRAELIGNFLKDVSFSTEYPNLYNILNESYTDEYDLVVITSSKDLYGNILNGLNKYDVHSRVKTAEADNTYAIILDGKSEDVIFSNDTESLEFKETQEEPSKSKLMQLSLGFDSKKVAIVQSCGLKIVPLTFHYQGWSSEEYTKAVISQYKNYGINPEYVIDYGQEVLGYPDSLPIAQEFFKTNHIKLGLVETSVQMGNNSILGLNDMIKNLNYDTVRVFNIAKVMQKKFQNYNYSGGQEIENIMYRAVTERNIRAVYFRPFMLNDNTYVTDFTEYEKTFHHLKARLADHDIKFGAAEPIPPVFQTILAKILISLGAMAGSVFLFDQLFKIHRRTQQILLLLGVVVTFIMFYAMEDTATIIFSIISAIIFPTIAMLYFVYRAKENYGNYMITSKTKMNLIIIRDLILTCMISLLGALLTSGMLSNIEYMLEINTFRGIKISQLVPMMLFLFIYLAYFGFRNKEHERNEVKLNFQDIKELALVNIKLIYVLCGILALIIGYIYIARTGHQTNVKASTLEIVFRDFLENHFLARPRTKEFLFAFPSMMLGLYMAFKGSKMWIFIFGTAAVIGQTSIVNTFCHIRTPLYISLVRESYAILLGIIIGLICIICLEAANKVMKTYGMKSK